MTKGNDRQDIGDFPEVLAEDRALDAIARGERIDDASSPVYALLSSARAEAEANIPAPPNLADMLGADFAVDANPAAESGAVASLGAHRRKKTIRRHARAAAASGLSVTSMFVAGGVAAALTIGGLGYAAYNGTLPTQKTPQTVQADADTSTSQQAPSSSLSSTPQQSRDRATTPAAPQRDNDRAPAPAPKPEQPGEEAPAPAEQPAPPEAPAPAEQPQPAPLPEGQVLAEGEVVPEGQGENMVGPMGAGEMGVMRAPMPGTATTTSKDDDDKDGTSTTSPRSGNNGGPVLMDNGQSQGSRGGTTDTTR